MSTLQRLDAIAAELSAMGDREDFSFIYDELIHRIRLDIERHGYTEDQAIDQIAGMAGYEPEDSARIEELEEEVSELEDKLREIRNIA